VQVVAQVLPAAFLGNDAPSGTPAAMLLEGSDAAPKDPAPLSGSKRRAEEDVVAVEANAAGVAAPEASAEIVAFVANHQVS